MFDLKIRYLLNNFYLKKGVHSLNSLDKNELE